MADDRHETPPELRPRKQPSHASREERPFDVWLNRQLHAMYDDIAHEPLPQDVLDLIERDGQQAAAEGAMKDGASHQSESEDETGRDKR